MRLRRFLPLLVAVPLILTVALVARAQVTKPSAELKVGTGVEKMELQGEATSFTVAPDSKLYAWTKVTGAKDTTVAIVFNKGDKTFKKELKVSSSPYRTNAYRTFRKGDEGSWTVKVVAADGAELGTASFTVEFQ